MLHIPKVLYGEVERLAETSELLKSVFLPSHLFSGLILILLSHALGLEGNSQLLLDQSTCTSLLPDLKKYIGLGFQ